MTPSMSNMIPKSGSGRAELRFRVDFEFRFRADFETQLGLWSERNALLAIAKAMLLSELKAGLQMSNLLLELEMEGSSSSFITS
jgi:hypothetical protein